MSITIDIGKCLNIFCLILAIDCMVSGIIVLKDKSIERVPRLVCYWFFRAAARGRRIVEQREKQTWVTRHFLERYSERSLAISSIAGGVFLVLLILLSLRRP